MIIEKSFNTAMSNNLGIDAKHSITSMENIEQNKHLNLLN